MKFSIPLFSLIRTCFVLIVGLLIFPIAVFAGEKVSESDWCTLVYPEKVVPGELFYVKVTPKKIPEGLKIGGDLHNAKPDAYLGFAAWGGDPKPAKNGETLTFQYRMPEFVSENQGAQPIFFLTNKGWDEATKKAFCPVILPDTSTLFASGGGGKNGVLDRDWCSIEAPEKAAPGETFYVKVTLKKDLNGMKFGGDLHNAKKDAYLGFAAWGGDLKSGKKGDTLIFRYKMPDYVADDQGVQPIFFATDQGWDEAKEKAPGPVILPLVTDEVRKTFRPKTATLKKSWLAFGTPTGEDGKPAVWKSGEKIVIPVEYYVDPEDDWGKTDLTMWIVGPWIDCPDGKYETSRKHMNSGVGVPDIPCEIGKRVKTSWTITLPKAYADAAPEKGKMGDSLLLIAQFRGADQKNWPWQLRAGLPCFKRSGGLFELDAPTPGNLFTYEQKVVMQVIPTDEARESTAQKPETLKWEVSDTQGKIVRNGTAEFPPKDGKTLEIPLDLDSEKGTFLFHAEIPGKDAREVTFARIPNLQKIIGNGPTPFGGQKFFGDEEAVRAARMMGMSSCRVWLSWQSLEPFRGVYNMDAWKKLHEDVAILRKNNLKPWFLLDGIPAWAIAKPDVYGGSFCALPVADADIQSIVTKLSTEFKSDILGFEWQNEIVPGTICDDPVSEYLRFCRVADAASKWVNPNFKNQIAGGLWPQTFRQSLIAAGIMEFTDILSIHYGNAGAARGAERDLATVGAEKRVILWDNETARGVSTWGMPLREAMKETEQSDYFFNRFPDELMAGCKNIVVFGGEASPAGDWSHFWSDLSPRPGAAALAVLTYALVDAAPVGEFSVGKNDSMKLFDRPGRPSVLVVSSIEKSGETVRLPIQRAKSSRKSNAASAVKVVKIDPQGNETPLQCDSDGCVSLKLSESGYLIEGGDPDVLKAQLVLSFPGITSSTASFTVISGQTLEIPLRFTNRLSRSIVCTAALDASTAPGTSAPVESEPLASGKSSSEMLKLENVRAGVTATTLTLKFDDPTLPTIRRKILINAVAPDEIGNLLKNPGFEQPKSSDEAKNDGAAANWGGSGHQGKRVAYSEPDALGHENFVYRFEKTGGKYFNIFQNVPKLPSSGGEYVYSFWIRSDNLTAGSNMGGGTADGKGWNRHWLEIFQAPKTQTNWQVFTKRIELPPETKSLSAAPVCLGDGWALIDNAILVPYEGTEFTAFAPKVKAGSIQIDGNLDDFQKSAPIPLLGENQLRTLEKTYVWTPENCSGAAYFNYDEQYLYAAFEVLDDRHVAALTEAATEQNDSIRLAIHPLNRLPGENLKAFCFDLSAAAPGGSGKHTIYRPAEFSGGLKSGSLAKDSSIYDIAVRREGNRTIYEVAMPWSDLGGVEGVVGTKIGLSLRLTDCDGRAPAAYMLWGEGLYPAWNPISFGMLTLIAPEE